MAANSANPDAMLCNGISSRSQLMVNSADTDEMTTFANVPFTGRL